ncbi:MAG: glycoside hydrolase family 25 protein [Lachnospiraceae bacterium]|nr:glycoside hydrolase family 25 protein [Lachnospiraceae bacterium]
MIDREKTEQEAYERGIDLDEMLSQASSGKKTRGLLEAEVDRLAEQNKRLRSHRRLWMILTWVMAAAAFVLCVLFWKEQNSGAGGNAKPTGAAEKKGTYRVCADPEAKIREYNDKGGKYTASLRTLLDTEYVAFSYGGLNNPEFVLLYRNEYPSAEAAAEGALSAWMETTQIIDFRVPYTLADNWENLTPEPVIMAGTKYVLFVHTQRDIPRSVVVLEPGKMNVGKEQDCFEAVRNWFTLATAKDIAPQSSDTDPTATPVQPREDVIVLTTGHGAKYSFSASEDVLAKVRESGSNALSYGEHYTWEITDDGIKITSLLYVKEGEYYGMVTAVLQPVQGTLRVANANVGAYVSYNFDDMNFDGVNTPAIDFIPNPVVLSNGTGEQLYLPEYKRVAKHTYNFDEEHYWQDEKGFRYVKDDEGNIISRMGIDVSKHKGEINWKKVADYGITFAIVRVGFRGPGEGTLEPDEYAKANIEGALANKLDVGVYFYSQAITVEEAIAEADYVLNIVKDYDINWPIVFDTEYYERKGARGNTTSREERTAVAKAFLDHITEAGYKAMLYSSTRWSILNVNRDELADYPFWFAYYGDTVSYRYDFNIWQYSSTGTVPGVNGDCDMDILLKPWD